MTNEKESVKLYIPADERYMDVVLAALYGIASKMGFCFEDMEDMKIAVTEACRGAVSFGERNGKSGELQLSFLMDSETLTIIVKDEESGYFYQRSIPPAQDDFQLSMLMLNSLVDQVHITQDGGTEVVLMKQVHRSGWL
ncbi:ATP-binding protein [Paenibacillus gansuensis]|uniref:ATP-binding protein n=1 Tax=Paenibacillus gansuensis TaxID=306542 RepID=A0ABW5PBY7_9BACL